jgi:hypothetical protein
MLRMATFGHVRRLLEIHDQLTAADLSAGFIFEGKRVPLVSPRRGIFMPQLMRHLSIKTVFPKPGAKVTYDDQRDVHRQIYEGEEKPSTDGFDFCCGRSSRSRRCRGGCLCRCRSLPLQCLKPLDHLAPRGELPKLLGQVLRPRVVVPLQHPQVSVASDR